ncbi:methyltransferase domain-containing protein [Ignavibacterium sp.]|uniref:class I SAM-dependent methyltransferase n=1 Tax=Ignavibacterium sp. TaxID=2651167 RepID=UPI00307F4CD5
MEVSSTSQEYKNVAWLDKSHPNYIRWERARKLSEERGRLVLSLLNQYQEISNKKILDIGSGEGGTSSILSKSNLVISIDLSLLRLSRQKQNYKTKNLVNCDAMNLPFRNNYFDIIILQDVIEHLYNYENFLKEIKKVLSEDGVIYLSTPNKLSIINFLSDPHWGLPTVSVLKRKTIRNIFLKYLRKSEVNRNDLAELLSLNEIRKYFSLEFEVYIQTNKVVKELFNGNTGIVWSNFHLSLIRILKRLSLHKLLISISNDNFGILNKYFTPTFYLVIKRKNLN